MEISQKQKTRIGKIIAQCGILAIGAFFLQKITSLTRDQSIITMIFIDYLLFLAPKKHRSRILLLPLCTGATFFLLSIGILPLYKTPPAVEKFKETQSTKYTTINETTGAFLKIEYKGNEKTIPLKETFQDIYSAAQEIQTFSLITGKNKEKSIFLIQYPDSTTIALLPNSKITLKHSKITPNTIEILYSTGQYEYYLPDDQTYILSGKILPKAKNTSNTFIGNQLIQRYKQEKQNYLITNMGGSAFLNPMLQRIQSNLLNMAIKIWPKRYKTNIQNYIIYKNALQFEDNSTNFENTPQIQKNILQEISRGIEETSIIKQITSWF